MFNVFLKSFVICLTSSPLSFVQFTIHAMGVLDLCNFTVGCNLCAARFISLKPVLTKFQNN